MDAQPPTIASLDLPVVTDIRVEQDGASKDCTNSTEG